MSKKTRVYLGLHLNLLLFSFASITSKLASSQPLFSLEFLLYLSILFIILVVYAIFWQKILKHLPLSSAYTSRSVLIIWGFLWGSLIFREKITSLMILGSLLIILGITLVVKESE
ncbi:MAG TPA: transporter [Erysipelotrichaceae bacterium]|nr:transporter [Erysipelotrichaceae bacterium]